MRYFLGIEPPASLADSVHQFQRERAAEALAPHITVKAPCGLSSDAAWLPTVKKVCQHFAAFQVQIDGIGSFGNSVLFLRVLSPGLINLHNYLIDELGTSSADQNACYEGNQYSPHLTLLQTRTDTFTQEVKDVAARRFGASVIFDANFLTIYRKDSNDEYRIADRVIFGGII
jgi:2'-5' RNA ligase